MASHCLPRAGTWTTRLSLAGLLRLAAAAALSFCYVPSARAQTPASDDVFYSRHSDFFIPFQADDRRIKEVILHVSEDQGQTWKNIANARPADGRFRFNARRDGWYYFTVQTRDFENRLYPARLEQVKPGLRVCVDTQLPTVQLEPLVPPEGGAGVKWDIRDDNLDLSSLVLEYREPGAAQWTRLNSQRIAAGQFVWNPAMNGTMDVRLQVRDLAGNAGAATTTVTPGSRAVQPLQGGNPAPRANSTGGIRYVNSTRINLNYKVSDVGKSGISKVELWVTLDGRSWQLHESRDNQQPPFTVEVKDERQYGFTLIARSGVGMGIPPPRLNDPPQVWVEVDLTKPVVRLEDIIVGKGADTGNLTILYKASDKNMAARPITISYAEKADGPWTQIVRGDDNTGRYVWKMPADVPYQMYIRVEAIDKAGNVGVDPTAQPVAVDLSQPKVQVIDVGPGGN